MFLSRVHVRNKVMVNGTRFSSRMISATFLVFLVIESKHVRGDHQSPVLGPNIINQII